MPLPTASLLTIDLQLRNLPSKLPEHEKQRLIALTAISYGGSLGRAVSFLSASKLCESDAISSDDPEARLADLDSALFVMGDLQACFMDAAYAAVEELFIALNEPPPSEGGAE